MNWVCANKGRKECKSFLWLKGMTEMGGWEIEWGVNDKIKFYYLLHSFFVYIYLFFYDIEIASYGSIDGSIK